METEAVVEQQQKDTLIEDVARHLSEDFEDTFALLLERRAASYSAAIAPLDAEIAALNDELESLEQNAVNLEGLLEARFRVAQHAADCFLLQGQIQEAAAKAAEAEAARNAPAAMRARQSAIDARIRTIESEKADAAIRAFGSFLKETKQIIRVLEHGLGIVFLNGAEKALLACNVGIAVNPSLFNDLTAEERSSSWQSLSAWYGSTGGLRLVRGPGR